MHVPSYHSEQHIKCAVSVLSLDVSRYSFPDGCELVSAVYDISANKQFPLPVTLKLQHCIPLNDQNEALKMSFVTADITQGYPYVFHAEDEGVFSCESSYGEIQLNHLSAFAIIRWYVGKSETFQGCVYCQNGEASFVVTRNLKSHLEVSCVSWHIIAVILEV